MDILEISCSLEDGDIVEVCVKHLIDDAVVEPTDIEESSSTFNKVNGQSGVGEDPFTSFDTRSQSTPTPFTTPATGSASTPTPSTTTLVLKYPFTATHFTKNSTTTTAPPRSSSTTEAVIEDVDDLISGPVESDFLEELGSDYSTEDSSEFEC